MPFSSPVKVAAVLLLVIDVSAPTFRAVPLGAVWTMTPAPALTVVLPKMLLLEKPLLSVPVQSTVTFGKPAPEHAASAVPGWITPASTVASAEERRSARARPRVTEPPFAEDRTCAPDRMVPPELTIFTPNMQRQEDTLRRH